jgi:hypothetical protein
VVTQAPVPLDFQEAQQACWQMASKAQLLSCLLPTPDGLCGNVPISVVSFGRNGPKNMSEVLRIVSEETIKVTYKYTREKPEGVVGDASSALGITKVFAASVSVLFFFWLRRRRHKKNMIATMIIRKASEPPTAPPMTALDVPLGLAAAVILDVSLGAEDILLAVENAVGAGTEDDSATLRSWK